MKTYDQQVVILAGGLGTRLKPFTEKVPKPLVEVAGKPFLHWQLQNIKIQGFRKVLLLVSYLGHMVQEYFGNGADFGLEISYGFEVSPMGTGGAIKNSIEKLEDSFFLLNGDSFLPLEMNAMWSHFENSHAQALVAVYDNRDKTPVPNNLKVAAGQVLGYEKNGGAEKGFNGVDAGAYVIRRRLFELDFPEKFDLETLWSKTIDQRELKAFDVSQKFFDIGTPERLKEFEKTVPQLIEKKLF